MQLEKTKLVCSETQLDSTNKKREVKNLIAQIEQQQDELNLLKSAYVRGEDGLENLLTDHQQIRSESDSLPSYLGENDSIDIPSLLNEMELLKQKISTASDPQEIALLQNKLTENQKELDLRQGTSVNGGDLVVANLNAADLKKTFQISNSKIVLIC